MSEENRELNRRRRRTEENSDEAIDRDAAVYSAEREDRKMTETRMEREIPDAAVYSAEREDREMTETRTEQEIPDAGEYGEKRNNRIPPEARRMSASPYGAVNAIAARRPGTRPPQVPPRPPVARPVRPEAAGRRPEGTGLDSPEEKKEATRQMPAARMQVGYAPGRMRESDASRARILEPQTPETPMNERLPKDSRMPEQRIRGQRIAPERMQGQRPIREYPENRYETPAPEDRKTKPAEQRHTVLHVITAVLLVIGLALAVVAAMPENNSMRQQATEIARKVGDPIQKILGGKTAEPARVESFSVTGNEKVTAPVDVIFAVTTDKSVETLRLVDEDGRPVETESTLVANAENNVWNLTLRVKDGYEGTLKLQTKRNRETWKDTEYSADLAISGSDAAGTGEAAEISGAPETAAQPETTGEDTGNPPEDPEGGNPGSADPKGASEGETAEGESSGDGESENETPGGEESKGGAGTEESSESGETGSEAPEGGEAEDGASEEETPEGGETGDEASGDGEPEGGETGEEETPPPEETPTPEPSPEPTATPPLTAEAAPGANPDLIAVTTVYSGSKKVKDYNRLAKELIHMPSMWDYTPQKIGVLTFRGNAFRTNAAVGTVSGAETLSLLWRTDGGSARGASQTYYGYEWTGQPAIVKWSSQVRQASNIDVDKQAKAPLLEVIIAGVDGVIRFLDLEDGQLTRSSINLGYPMKGTPSLHPAGYPYMNVGQFARKMKVKTGKIGLRQYNLYTQKEMSLIDGLDGKMHRGLNNVGSFETSALIDRTSDTVITLGSNGLLYLISLNTNFDYKAGVLKTNPSTVVMASRTKAQQKNKALVAVESSPAMYDRYVFYADMGGVLRCVDTNFLTTVWAVETGDAVMAAVALDFNQQNGLDLYTANMLTNRKKGDVQIRRYDAMSGKEIWSTSIGVAKDTKKKDAEDVGCKASPVIGEHGLSELVYFTVTGLNEDGRTALKTGAEAKAAVVALEKETGELRWARELSDRSESSPVAVYDPDGKGWIIQCAEDGKILMMDGLTGEVVSELQVEGNIKASPAVYNDILVVGTTGKGKEAIVGVRIH